MLNTKNLKLILEYDDFCDQSPENCLNFIEKCVEEIPKIKFNLFTVPKTRGFEIKDPSWISRVKNLISNKNISICVHGLFHTTEEFKFLSKKEAIFRLKTAMNIFEKNNIDFLKVFRGPQWGINEYTFEALIDFQKKGKILEIGTSNYNPDEMEIAQTAAKKLNLKIATTQLHYNLIESKEHKNYQD